MKFSQNLYNDSMQYLDALLEANFTSSNGVHPKMF